jgi:hypothetical protein
MRESGEVAAEIHPDRASRMYNRRINFGRSWPVSSNETENRRKSLSDHICPVFKAFDPAEPGSILL